MYHPVIPYEVTKLMLFLHKRFLMEKNHTFTRLAEPKDLMHTKQFSTFAEKFKPLNFHRNEEVIMYLHDYDVMHQCLRTGKC